MVWVIPFCSPVAELHRWLGTQKLSGVYRSAQTRQVHIKSPCIHLHTPPNPTCSRWYDHEWLIADYKACFPLWQTQPKAFQLFLNFLPMVLTKIRMGFLKFWKLKFFLMIFFSFSLTWDPMGAKISTSFHPIWAKPYKNVWYILAICKTFKFCGTLKFYSSQWET